MKFSRNNAPKQNTEIQGIMENKVKRILLRDWCAKD